MARRISMTVDTGALGVDILDVDGNKVGELEFNPADLSIIRRYEEVVENLNALNFDDEDGYEAAKKMEASIKEQLDYLLACEASKGAFSKYSPLAVKEDGDFFFEGIFEGVAKLIEEHTNTRLEAKLAKVRKATEKYTK